MVSKDPGLVAVWFGPWILHANLAQNAPQRGFSQGRGHDQDTSVIFCARLLFSQLLERIHVKGQEANFFAMLLNLSRVIPVEGFWHHMARYGTVRLFLALAGWFKGCRTQQFHIALGTQVLTKLWNTGWAFDRGNLRWTWSWGWCGCCRILQGCASDVGIFRGHLQPGALCSWCRSYNFQDLCFAS